MTGKLHPLWRVPGLESTPGVAVLQQQITTTGVGFLGAAMPARIVYRLDQLLENMPTTRGRMSWAKVARETGLSPQLLSKLRHGESVITNVATLVVLKRYFRCRRWEDLIAVEFTDPDEVRLDELFPDRRAWEAPPGQGGDTDED
jgi:Cro/C1-type helix-turn-helix DNA-binding protein